MGHSCGRGPRESATATEGAMPMSSILSRIAAVGIIAGGFALTGDLGKLTKRGLDVINSRDVPTAGPTASGDAPPASPLVDADTAEAKQMPATAEAIVGGKPSAPSASAGSPRGQATIAKDVDFRPPQRGIDAIEVSSLAAGNRVVVWLAMPRRSGGRAYRCLVFDIVDPATGEALAYEAVSFAADGNPQATASPPRRVRLQSDGRVVATSGVIDIQRRGVAADGIGHETIGPIAALDLIR